MALVTRLVKEHGSLEKLLAKSGIEMHQGYIEGNRERPVPPELHDLPCLSGGGMPQIELTVDELPPFTEEFLEGPRNPDIYRGPLVLCASGLAGNRIVAAYCKEDVVYSVSQFAASFRKGAGSMAFYINAVLNSSLATYLTFLTATKWGLDKYEILPNDVLRLPVPEPGDAEAAQFETIREIERALRKAARAGQYDQARAAQLDKAIFDLYGLDRFERVIVEDMISSTIDFQRNHDKSHATHTASVTHCKDYAEYLIAVIQPFLETLKKRRIIAEVIDVDAPLRVIRFKIAPWSGNGPPAITVRKTPEFQGVLDEIEGVLNSPIALDIQSRRHLRVYAGDAFYIVKPSQRRFWTRSAGLADGDSVMKDFLAQGAT
jgi:hypothetical protein